MTIQKFRNLVWKHYAEHGRHDLPWRKTRDPYRILVSEIMLQQTQVERVKGFYAAWLKRFPTVAALAAAPLSEVLTLWQGLGYNRRAKMLHEAAKRVVQEYAGKLPKTPEALQTLPGIGPYTARAVAAFAYDTDTVFIETNLRTAVLHHFFSDADNVSDREVLAVLEHTFVKGRSREWWSALMDYGAYLKRSGVRINSKSTGYAKQAAFAGSGRQARGAILKELMTGPKTGARLSGLLGDGRMEQLASQLQKLSAEGMIVKEGRSYHLPN